MQPPPTPATCATCGRPIPPDAAACPVCGYLKRVPAVARPPMHPAVAVVVGLVAGFAIGCFSAVLFGFGVFMVAGEDSHAIAHASRFVFAFYVVVTLAMAGAGLYAVRGGRRNVGWGLVAAAIGVLGPATACFSGIGGS